MPRIFPGSPGLLFEAGLSSRLPPRAWFGSPPPRDVDVAGLVRTSYGSTTGKTMVGVGLLLGIPTLVIGIAAMATEPLHIVTATMGGLFATFFVVVPALPALRFGRALRLGVIDHANVAANPNGKPPGYRIVDRRGRDVPFDPRLMWRTTLKVGADVDLLVDPTQGNVLWILGPADEAWPAADDPGGSRTMPGR